MTTQGDTRGDLAEALRAVRAAVAEVDYPLPLPSAAPARAAASAVLAQLDDYALPRLADLRAPLLVVVGGSTGAGKSTLVNSLVRAPVSPAGVLRPTTRTPVLVCHPADAPWFRGRGQQQLITAPALPAGLAFLDAVDIDSVEDANRALAPRLLDAADLWLFLTTPTRYADAVPWRLLRTARERGTVIALVLSRVPPPAAVDLVTLLADLLTEQGLGKVPLFVLPETRVDRQGLLPEPATEPLRTWFEALAGNADAREDVVRCTLDGALAGLPHRLTELAEAADEQLTAAEALAEQVGVAYGLARGTIERGLATGATASQPAGDDPRGPARLAGWARWLALRRPRLAGRAGDHRARHRRTATETGLVTLVRGAAADAADQVGTGWRTHPAGSALAAAEHRRRGAWPDLPVLSPELARRVQRLVREEHGDLRTRLAELFDSEAARWLERLGDVPLGGAPGQRLRDSAAALERARQAARLAVSATTDRWTAVATDPSRYAPHVQDAPAAKDAPPAEEAPPAQAAVTVEEAAPAESAPAAEDVPAAGMRPSRRSRPRRLPHD